MNHKIIMTIASAIIATTNVIANDKVNDWENPAVNSINRLAPRAYTVPLADLESALSDDLEVRSPFKVSLNGNWKLKWVGDPNRRPLDFYKTDFDDSRWGTVDVPSCLEMRGYGVPHYTNVRFPHKNMLAIDPNKPLIRDRDNGRDDFNPVASYRRKFVVPDGWKGRDIFLRFDGVYSAYTVWVNGEKVGYAEDSKLPSEFNVTSFVKEGENQIAVQVFRWCDGSYLEDQDMFRFTGIFRDVSLWSMPKDGIWDFVVKTDVLDSEYKKWKLAIIASGADVATLYDTEKKEVAKLVKGENGDFTAELEPLLWSAETPNLYTLVLKKGDDIRSKKIGFKEQKIVGNEFFVNGKPVKFRGVNRHETNPENGRTVSLDDMIKDATLMKKYNINTVRTCHYPDHYLWYSICDKFGLYVIAEANVEGHEPGYREHAMGKFAVWDHTIVERNVRHAEFYRDNVSVTMWSMGNETGHGDCFRHAIAEVKKVDPSRPIHWERGNPDADVDSSMYPSVEWVIARGKLGNKKAGESLSSESGGEGFQMSEHTAGKAFIMCEYAHAMGNAVGNLQEYWDAIYEYPALLGGCIWDWIDQAVWKTTDRVDPKTGLQERYLAYGGDYDEEPNDGPFCNNGIICPLRKVSAKLIEVGHVYRGFAITRKGEGFELWNHYSFLSTDSFIASWKVFADGEEVAKGPIAMPAVAPLTRDEFAMPEEMKKAIATIANGKEIFVNFEFATKRDEPWAKAGWILSRDQVAIARENVVAKEVAKEDEKVLAMTFDENEKEIIFERARTTAIFDRATGALRTLVMKGVTVFDSPGGVIGGPQFTCARAMTDNDKWMAFGGNWNVDRSNSFYANGMTQLRYHPEPLTFGGNSVTSVVDVTGSKGAGFKHTCVYTFASDGSVSLANKVEPYGNIPKALPRIGLTMRLPPRLEQMRYYGRGPEENYIDRCTGSFVGIYKSTVKDQFVDYIRPQDNGGKSAVRWAEFTDKQGKGVRFSASEPMFMQALHYGWEDLELSRHQSGSSRRRAPLIARSEIMLNLDVRQTGLGGASCGPVPMKKYLFNPRETFEWTLKIENVK